jgi:hypothetical protein
MADENANVEVPETISVRVTAVIERLIERQTGIEARIAALEDLTRHLAGALHMCKEALLGQQRVLEAQSDYKPPDPRKASSN